MLLQVISDGLYYLEKRFASILSVFYEFETLKFNYMTKDEIIDQMIDEMPFNLSENIRPYVKEAMDIYAQQEVKNCNILAVSKRSELLFAFIKEWKEEFKDENWDYLDFVAERVLSKQ